MHTLDVATIIDFPSAQEVASSDKIKLLFISDHFLFIRLFEQCMDLCVQNLEIMIGLM